LDSLRQTTFWCTRWGQTSTRRADNRRPTVRRRRRPWSRPRRTATWTLRSSSGPRPDRFRWPRAAAGAGVEGFGGAGSGPPAVVRTRTPCWRPRRPARQIDRQRRRPRLRTCGQSWSPAACGPPAAWAAQPGGSAGSVCGRMRRRPRRVPCRKRRPSWRPTCGRRTGRPGRRRTCRRPARRTRPAPSRTGTWSACPSSCYHRFRNCI